ncbi:arsenate reductase (glutaredoxin) [Emcibacter sp.]|uniref:arsenate reductase (glutaredoxin) n=1 Tax=Emcibacter sp. TaxID=1979954 RepID=UPI003A92E673
MTVTIYHNPRCSKSRQTLALLEEQGIAPEVVEYLNDVPTREQLADILKMLGLSSARDLMRKKEAEYKENGLDDESLSEDQLLEAMTRHPKLIERPIVVKGGKAAIGRPPESVLEIL